MLPLPVGGIIHLQGCRLVPVTTRGIEEWTEEQKVWLADGLRDTTAQELLIEFKFTESMTEQVFTQLFVYDHLYRAKQKLGRDGLKSFLLLSKTPSTDVLEQFGFVPTDKAGVYASGLPLFGSLCVILLNELSVEPHNAVWKCFASQRKEWQKAFNCIDQHGLSGTSVQHEHVMFGIRRIRMDGAMENVEPIGLTPEYVMDLGRREWFESMLNALPDEELSKIRRTTDIQQKSRQEGEAKLLVRQLVRRFGALPAAVHEKIATADSDALERWGDLVLDARSIEEVFGPDH